VSFLITLGIFIAAIIIHAVSYAAGYRKGLHDGEADAMHVLRERGL
jgi:hypothetical protein